MYVQVCACVHVACAYVCVGMGRCMCVGVCIRVHACAGVCLLVPRDPSVTADLGRTCGVSRALCAGGPPAAVGPLLPDPHFLALLTPGLFPDFLLSSAVHFGSSP